MSEALVEVKVRKETLDELRRLAGGEDEDLVERVLEEWLARQRIKGATGWAAFDELVGMFDGPGDLAARHDEFGLGADHR